MAQNKTEGLWPEEFLISELPGQMSREAITVLHGQNLAAGAVLGKVTMGAAVGAIVAGSTGTGACGTITVTDGAKPGVYQLTCIKAASNAGTFTVEDPDGIALPEMVVASAYSSAGLAFTWADATDFIVGDQLTITVAAGSGKYVAVDPTAVNGAQVAVAVLARAADATDADVAGLAFARFTEVNANELGFGTLDAGAIVTAKAQLKTATIFVREAI